MPGTLLFTHRRVCLKTLAWVIVKSLERMQPQAWLGAAARANPASLGLGHVPKAQGQGLHGHPLLKQHPCLKPFLPIPGPVCREKCPESEETYAE